MRSDSMSANCWSPHSSGLEHLFPFPLSCEEIVLFPTTYVLALLLHVVLEVSFQWLGGAYVTRWFIFWGRYSHHEDSFPIQSWPSFVLRLRASVNFNTLNPPPHAQHIMMISSSWKYSWNIRRILQKRFNNKPCSAFCPLTHCVLWIQV